MVNQKYLDKAETLITLFQIHFFCIGSIVYMENFKGTSI